MRRPAGRDQIDSFGSLDLYWGPDSGGGFSHDNANQDNRDRQFGRPLKAGASQVGCQQAAERGVGRPGSPPSSASLYIYIYASRLPSGLSGGVAQVFFSSSLLLSSLELSDTEVYEP